MGGEYIFHHLNDTQLDQLYESAASRNDFPESKLLKWNTIKQYPRIFIQLAKEVMARKSQLFDGLEDFYSQQDEIKDIYENMTVVGEHGKEFIPSETVEFSVLNSYIDVCFVHNFPESRFSFKTKVDVVMLSDMRKDPIRYMDVCYYQMFVRVAQTNKTCKKTAPHDLLRAMFGSENPFFHVHDVGRSAIFFAVVCVHLYIILDIVERCTFVSHAVRHQTLPGDIICTALEHKIPGSYVRKQLNVLSCFAIIFQYYFEKYVIQVYTPDRSKVESYWLQEVVSVVFIIAIVVRFLIHIHTLRLLPGIGHFVITTFMMGTNLIHFSAVFGIVLCIFSVLFHILIDDPNCPLEKANGFVTVADSLFSTFQLTFGHGNFDPYSSSPPVQLTYVLYVVIMGLLLLNLIIAIMSTTATDILQEPWKQVLWKIEWLDEATSAEYTFSLLCASLQEMPQGTSSVLP